ncbi:hypothetical protein BPMI_04120c [Candidatus Burkholderia pumila]|uniref:Uncharacterized protein n=1 Tax=Candidatus Burkholderia pumila TaxID=1090375 RepID=A0ABR5HNL2_9BURK|nr:hypothetical protein BPMI_04120c [Candidatus Burkholderia pumila]
MKMNAIQKVMTAVAMSACLVIAAQAHPFFGVGIVGGPVFPVSSNGQSAPPLPVCIRMRWTTPVLRRRPMRRREFDVLFHSALGLNAYTKERTMIPPIHFAALADSLRDGYGNRILTSVNDHDVHVSVIECTVSMALSSGIG